MATIKAKNGKVILKNGKAACECCVPNCPIYFDLGEENVFEITKKEYFDYHNRGNWKVFITDEIYRSFRSFTGYRFTQFGSGSKEFNYQLSGCYRGFGSGFTYPVTTIVGGGEPFVIPGSSNHDLFYALQIINKKFYMKFGNWFSWAIFGALPPEESGFFGKAEGTINGNTIKMHSRWNDPTGSFAREYGLPYINNSICTLEVTFTPNP